MHLCQSAKIPMTDYAARISNISRNVTHSMATGRANLGPVGLGRSALVRPKGTMEFETKDAAQVHGRLLYEGIVVAYR